MTPTTTYRTTRWGAVGAMVEHLRQLLHDGERDPNVAELSRLAVASASPADSDAQAILAFVRGNFPYQLDPGEGELFIHPRIMARDYLAGSARSGDCDDLALLSGALMGALGHKTRIVLLDTDMDGRLDHAVSEYWSERLGGWVTMDATGKYPVGWVHNTTQTRVVE